ncbi:MAG: glycosyltransferase family 4 protein [Eubacteriales bacterium]|nr:glycosyltransferase family 4 protein [Eubacteriales bacterium]
MKRVLFLTNYASPYRVRFFDQLGKSTSLTVLCTERIEEKTHRDAGWFVSGQGHFDLVHLSRRLFTVRGKAMCLDVVDWLKKPFDTIVICGYSSPTAMLAMAHCRLHRIPYYLEVDGGLVRRENRIKYWYKRLLVGSADAWLSTGQRTTDFLVHYGARRERVFCYPFTSLEAADLLDKPVAAEEKAALRAELGMAEGRILLSIGQFIHRKGFDVLLKAARTLPEDVGVYIVGGEPTEEYLKLRESLGLENVHFCGFQKKEDLARYYKAADLFVLPTREDIWGLVVNEAMAFGLPVITTGSCVAGLELVEEGVNGLLVPAGDAQALARAMSRVLAGDMAKMGAAALATAGGYTIENMAKAHVEIFEGR